MSGIIDGHIHYLLRDNEEKNLLSAMNEAGVERSVLLPLPPLDFQDACTAGNEVIYEVCRRHPDRLSFGVFADPRQKDAVEIVRKYADLGAKVFKLYPPIGFFPDDSACFTLYETLAQLGLPVLSHTGATDLAYWKGSPRSGLSSHFADPIRFDGPARKFPEITWILAHTGFPWCVNAWFTAAVNSNVYLDIAGGSFWSTSLPYLYNSIGRQIPIDFNKVIWGSDNCLPPAQHLAFSRQLLKDLGCEESFFPAVFGQTVAKLLGLVL
jgi:uncharacterized protein